MNRFKKIAGFLGVALIVLYPFVVYKLLGCGISLRYMAILVMFMVLYHYKRWHNYSFLAAGLILITFLLMTNKAFFLKLYPVMMNGGIALLFLTSLRSKPLITVFAEKMGHEMTPQVLTYTRQATFWWGVFMAGNTFLSVITLFTSDFIWALYNGFIAYILIGLAFITELYFRRRLMHD